MNRGSPRTCDVHQVRRLSLLPPLSVPLPQLPPPPEPATPASILHSVSTNRRTSIRNSKRLTASSLSPFISVQKICSGRDIKLNRPRLHSPKQRSSKTLVNISALWTS